MKWTELIEAVAERSGTSQAQTRQVLTALVDTVTEALVDGADVRIRSLGTFSTAWHKSRVLRSVHDGRRMLVGGRYVIRFRASRPAREAVAARTDQHWRDPEHQAAWRLAETLVSDLAMYHDSRAPDDISPEAEAARVDDRCMQAFGSLWNQARRTFEQKVPPTVREEVDYLARAARRRWS